MDFPDIDELRAKDYLTIHDVLDIVVSRAWQRDLPAATQAAKSATVQLQARTVQLAWNSTCEWMCDAVRIV